MNGEAVRVSTCVDCATTVIGERLRCPRCHERHADDLVDEDVTTPRVREGVGDAAILRALVAWIVLVEIGLVLIFGVVLMTRGCL